MDPLINVPPAWLNLATDELTGVLMVLGGTDVGKSTFARYLYRSLRTKSQKVAFLDGDPGQSFLGPPTTLTLVADWDGEIAFPRINQVWRYFIGSTTPRGHMLPTLVGAARLARAAQSFEAEVLVYDTSGLIDPLQGGLALKSAKIDLLRPTTVFAIQREQELEPLLVPLRRSQRTRVVNLCPSADVERRDFNMRRQYRMRQFAHYFAGSTRLLVEWTKLAVFPMPLFRLNRLVALEDSDGFTVGLGIIREIDRPGRRVDLYSPLASLEGVNALHLGNILLDPDTFRDEKIFN